MKQKIDRDWLNIIICFTLALLLVMSLSLSLSGAWFTDSDTSSGSGTQLRFGSVKVGENPVVVTVSNLMPSQTISYYGSSTSGIQYSGNVGAYYRISFTVSNIKNADTSVSVSTPTVAQLKALLTFSGTNKASDGNLYGEVVASGLVPSGTITFAKSADNTYSRLSFNITLKVSVMQSGNITLAQSGTTAEKIKGAFDSYYSA